MQRLRTSMTVLLLTMAAVLAAAEQPPATTLTTVNASDLSALSRRFAARMSRIRRNLAGLRSERLQLAPQLEKIVSDSAEARQLGFSETVSILEDRIGLEKQILEDLDEAQRLYQHLGEASTRERERLLGLNTLMEQELAAVGDDLAAQVARLSEVLAGDRQLAFFRHYTDNKTEFFEAMRRNLESQQDLPGLEGYFQRWQALLRTRLLADQHQLLTFAHYANAFKWIDGRNRAMAAVSDADAASLVEDLGEADVSAANLTAMLNSMFGELVNTASNRPPGTQPEPLPIAGFGVSVTPDRGPGGTYYYSNAIAGLRDPAPIQTTDGSTRYGERVRFTINADRDCRFIMRHVDAAGHSRQLCPNSYAPGLNRVRANQQQVVPSADSGFEFVANGPPGIESVRLIVEGAGGKAVIVETWFRVLPLPGDEAVD